MCVSGGGVCVKRPQTVGLITAHCNIMVACVPAGCLCACMVGCDHTGELVCEVACGSGVASGPPPSSATDLLPSFACVQVDGSTVWNVSTVDPRMKWPATQPIRASPAITSDGLVIVRGWDSENFEGVGICNNVYAFNSKDGSLVWAGRDGAGGSTASVTIDGAGRCAGRVLCIAVPGGTRVWCSC